MKNFAIAAVILFGTSLCYAEMAATPAATKPMTQSDTVMVSGKVKSVTVADAAKNIPASIVVTDAEGKDMQLAVTPTTRISDKEKNQMTFDKVAVGAEVSVKYMKAQDGTGKATSIRVK